MQLAVHIKKLCKNDIINYTHPTQTSIPSSAHCFETAECIRASYPDKDWLQLMGLIHGIGKMVNLWEEPCYAITRDTSPVGSAFSNKCVLYKSWKENPNHRDHEYTFK